MYRAKCIREIFWKGTTYRAGDPIKILDGDVMILSNAGVIGDVKKIAVDAESAMEEPPENAMAPRIRGRKRAAVGPSALIFKESMEQIK